MPTPKTTPPAAEKLLPCPFCGGELNAKELSNDGGWYVLCGECEIDFFGAEPFSEKRYTVEAFNERINARPQSAPDAPPVQRGVSKDALEWLGLATCDDGPYWRENNARFRSEILAALAHKGEGK